MTEPAPLQIPHGLAALVQHNPTALHGVRAARKALQQDSGLTPQELEMITLAAFITMSAPAESFDAHIARLLALGESADRVWGLLQSLITIVGVPRIVHSTPLVAHALATAGSER